MSNVYLLHWQCGVLSTMNKHSNTAVISPPGHTPVVPPIIRYYISFQFAFHFIHTPILNQYNQTESKHAGLTWYLTVNPIMHSIVQKSKNRIAYHLNTPSNQILSSYAFRWKCGILNIIRLVCKDSSLKGSCFQASLILPTSVR